MLSSALHVRQARSATAASSGPLPSQKPSGFLRIGSSFHFPLPSGTSSRSSSRGRPGSLRASAVSTRSRASSSSSTADGLFAAAAAARQAGLFRVCLRGDLPRQLAPTPRPARRGSRLGTHLHHHRRKKGGRLLFADDRPGSTRRRDQAPPPRSTSQAAGAGDCPCPPSSGPRAPKARRREVPASGRVTPLRSGVGFGRGASGRRSFPPKGGGLLRLLRIRKVADRSSAPDPPA